MTAETMSPIRGSTASSAIPGPRTPGAPPGPTPPRPAGQARSGLGNALRVIGVFVDTAFRVVVLGTDGTRQPDPSPAARRAGRAGGADPRTGA